MVPGESDRLRLISLSSTSSGTLEGAERDRKRTGDTQTEQMRKYV